MKKIFYIFICSIFMTFFMASQAKAMFFTYDYIRMIYGLMVIYENDKANDQLSANNGIAFLILEAIGFGVQNQEDVVSDQVKRIEENLEVVEYVETALKGKESLLETAIPSLEDMTASMGGDNRIVALQMAEQARAKFVNEKFNTLFFTKEEYSIDDVENLKIERFQHLRNASLQSHVVAAFVKKRALKQLEELTEGEDTVAKNLRQEIIKGTKTKFEKSMVLTDLYILATLNLSMDLYDAILKAPFEFIEE